MKLDLSNYFDKKTLIIFDIDSLAKNDYVSTYMGNKGGKPAFSFNLNGKNHNSTIIFGILSRLVHANFYIDDVDFMASFDTKPNFLNYIHSQNVENAFDKSNEYYSQLVSLRHSLKDLGVTILEKDGIESYSLIYEAVSTYYSEYEQIIIYSRDKVLYDIVRDEKVAIVVPSSKQDLTYNNYETFLGVPQGLINYKLTMLGDSSLNLKGVTGVGVAKFNKLLSDYDFSKSIVDNIKSTPLLKDNQKEMALSIYDWLLPSEVSLETTIKKINSAKIGQYLEFYECSSLKEKLI